MINLSHVSLAHLEFTKSFFQPIHIAIIFDHLYTLSWKTALNKDKKYAKDKYSQTSLKN